MNSLAGQAVGGVKAVEPARKIVEDMVTEAGGCGTIPWWTTHLLGIFTLGPKIHPNVAWFEVNTTKWQRILG